MKGRNKAPKQRDPSLLPGGGTLGSFWRECKRKRRCESPLYGRLLDNPVLREDYRTTPPKRHERSAVSKASKVRAIPTQKSALELMAGRERKPAQNDATELPGGSKLGTYWENCKWEMRCGRPPYNLLLTNPLLRADYRE